MSWKKRILLATLSLFILAGLAVGVVAVQFAYFIAQPLSQTIDVTIPKGWGTSRVAGALEDANVVSSARLFRLLAQWDGRGVIQAGEYRFVPGQNPYDVLQQLKKGEVLQHRISFPEGLTAKEIVGVMRKAGLSGTDALLDHPRLAMMISESNGYLEGWLYPSTYLYTKGETALGLVTRMVLQTRKIMETEWSSKEPSYGLTRYETLILASIIEKETGLGPERPLISGVFHNRLQRKMKLQTDPTVIYGIADFDGDITRQHLKTPTPYNTYLISGLPPTPICNPGQQAIHAALHPETTEALYFVSRGDGSHVFSKTFEEHKAYVDCYQRKKGCDRVRQ